MIDAMREQTRGLTLREIIEHMLQASGLVDFYKTEREGEDRIENLEELVNAAEGFVTQEGFGKDAVALPVDEPAPAAAPSRRARARSEPAPSVDARPRRLRSPDAETGEIMSPLAAFLTHASLEAGDNQAQAGQDAIQLMTVHSAKGLEFDCVFITGLEEGLFPHENSLERPRRPRGGAPPDVRGDHARAQAPVPELLADAHAARPDPLQRQEPLLRRAARGGAAVDHAAQPGLRLGLRARVQRGLGARLGAAARSSAPAAVEPRYNVAPIVRRRRRTACGRGRACSTPSSAKASSSRSKAAATTRARRSTSAATA